MYIKEYEDQENKLAKTRDIPIRKEYDAYRETENQCITPILEILKAIYDTYVMKIKQSNSSSIDYLSTILETQKNKEITIYDYFKTEVCGKIEVKNLIQMKSDYIKQILMHDSEGLHNTILTWMIDKELYDDLEKVDSPYYDKFVEKVENLRQFGINQISLVYKYLLKTKKFNRLIHFLTPVIWDESDREDRKVKGEYSIKHRLLYLDICQKA